MALVERHNAPLVFYDIETSFNIGGYFGRKWDTNIAKVIHTGYVLGFAWKVEGEKKIQSCYIWDFPRYKKHPRDDVEVIKKWVEVVANGGIPVGHNSDKFDNAVMMGRAIVHHLDVQRPAQTIDTIKMARKAGKFDSYKLDDLCEQFGLGRKLHTDIDLWWDCMQGIPKAQKQMVKYNKRDVDLTEKLYRYLLPYAPIAPNRATIEGKPTACPKCGVDRPNLMLSKGFTYTKTGVYRSWTCKACGSRVKSRTPEKAARPEFV